MPLAEPSQNDASGGIAGCDSTDEFRFDVESADWLYGVRGDGRAAKRATMMRGPAIRAQAEACGTPPAGKKREDL
jgi:hypothetical protein